MLRTTDKGYWIAHSVFKKSYSFDDRCSLLSSAFPTKDRAIEFYELFAKVGNGSQNIQGLDVIIKTVEEGHPNNEHDQRMVLLRALARILEYLPIINREGIIVQETKKIVVPTGSGLARIEIQSSIIPSRVRNAVKEYVGAFDKYSSKTLGTEDILPEYFPELVERFTKAREQHLPDYEALKWALLSNENAILRIIASDSLALQGIPSAPREVSTDLKKLITKLRNERDKAQRFAESQKERVQTVTTRADQYGRTLTEKDRELLKIRGEYATKEQELATLSEKLRTLEAGKDGKSLEEALFEKELAREELGQAKEQLQIIRTQADEWKDIADHAEADVERLRATTTELWEAIHEQQETILVDPTRRETYAQRFQQSGLDYDIIDAIIVVGFKGPTFIGKSYLPIRHVKTNTFGKLQRPEQVPLVGTMLEHLVRCNAVTLWKKDEAVSVNPHVRDIEPPALKEYIAEILQEVKHRRSGTN